MDIVLLLYVDMLSDFCHCCCLRYATAMLFSRHGNEREMILICAQFLHCMLDCCRSNFLSDSWNLCMYIHVFCFGAWWCTGTRRQEVQFSCVQTAVMLFLFSLCRQTCCQRKTWKLAPPWLPALGRGEKKKSQKNPPRG